MLKIYYWYHTCACNEGSKCNGKEEYAQGEGTVILTKFLIYTILESTTAFREILIYFISWNQPNK